MLPARMKIHKKTEEYLRRLKQQTKIAPNVASRIAFFNSVESGFRYVDDGRKPDSSLVLDKHTWLGDMELAIETTCRFLYPEFDSKELEKAWAAHVEDGASTIL